MEASIIIPTFNKSEYLNLTLASFTNQSFKNYEIIIIDDGSNDMTKEIYYKYKNQLNIIYHYQDNKGRANARNVAIDKASGKYIIFNDDDRIVSPHFVESHLNKLKTKSDNTVVIGWKNSILTIWKDNLNLNQMDLIEIIRKNPDLLSNKLSGSENSIKLLESRDILLFENNIINKYVIESGADNFSWLFERYGKDLLGFSYHWIVGTTANMSVNREFLLEVGLFDEKFLGWGMEDTDLSYRLSKNGADFIYCKEAYNFHQYHPRERQSKLSKQLRNNVLYFAKKYNTLETLLYFKSTINDIDITQANDMLLFAGENNSIVYKDLLDTYRQLLPHWEKIFNV